jgi:sugar phosphate isomerase/epimerase
MGQKVPIAQAVDLAAKAGYQAIEPWIRELEQHTEQGGSLRDLRKRIADAGLTVESAIGFAPWCVDDDAQRTKGFEQARRDMDLVAQIGGKRIAAPPAGVSGPNAPDLFRVAERYRKLLEIGRNIGVVPQVENWGMSKTIGRLGQAVLVAVESGHPDACLLPDVYHIFRGGSDFGGLALLRGSAIHVFHTNDYPADPPRDKLSDAHRVYPGDGVAPLTEILRTLRSIGFDGYLSLELFNRDYWSRDPFQAAKTGLEKMQRAVQAAG